jgi:hypothetical protein
MVHIYYEITIYIYNVIFPSGARLPLDPPARGIAPSDPIGGVTPPVLPLVEESTLFMGVNFSWGINMAENKDL